jgi:hypothetical protein
MRRKERMSVCAAISTANPSRLSGVLVKELRKEFFFVYAGDSGDDRHGEVRLEWRIWNACWVSWDGGIMSCWCELGKATKGSIFSQQGN